MNIGTRQWLATGAALAAIGVIAAAVAWTGSEVADADRQRRHTTALAQGLGELRLVTFEYVLNRQERARVQWYAIADRIDRLIALNQSPEPAQKEILTDVRERRVAAQRLFDELVSASAAHDADAPGSAISRRFEAQLLNRMLIHQQNNTADAFRLSELASERIDGALRRASITIFAGLSLLALITAWGAWLMHRGVLTPIVQLQRATQMIAAGDLKIALGIPRDDEIGEMARNFDAMAHSLRESLARVERSNRALAAAEERFRAMFESAPIAMVMVDQAGAIVQVNARTETLFGYARDALAGQSIELLVPQSARGTHQAHREGFSARPQALEMRARPDLRGRRKNGGEIPVEIALNPITTEQGQFVLSAIVDLTEREQALEEITQLNAALVLRTSQLEAVNQELESFSYSVSHDLRGPLRSMDGFALVLLEDHGDKLDVEGKDALARIRAASQRMGRLIDDLLRLSQVTRAGLKLKRVDLSGMVRAVAESLQGERPGRTVEWTIEEGMTITADTELMRILMQNLLQNAWKFTARTERPAIRVGTLERDGRKVCFVADNGAGFDMAHADRLFGAFQRLHHAADFPGAGIGLAIAQRIIHRHDGKIWAEAKEGAGATFFFNVGDLEYDPSRRQDHPAG